MAFDALFILDRPQAYVAAAVAMCQVAVAALLLGGEIIDREKLRRALRTLTIAFRVHT